MRMLYRVPGNELLHGIPCEYQIVPDTAQAIAEAEAHGWRRSPAEAKAAAEAQVSVAVAVEQTVDHTAERPAEVALTERESLEAEAERLGIKVDGRWSLARLRSEIEKHAD